MLGLRSARRQALLASVALLALLVSIAALAAWRAQRARETDRAVDGHAVVAAALDDARSQALFMAAQMAASIFSEDPASMQELYPRGIFAIDEDMKTARAALTDMGELDKVAVLDMVDSEMNQLMADPNVVNAVGSLSGPHGTELGEQYYPLIWPKVEKMMADVEQLADGERSRLAAEQARASSDSTHTFGLLVGLSLFAVLGAFATLGVFIMSLLRPLASLQKSARAITSGNLEERANVSGPEETASLARDFNEMTETLVERSALLQESESRFRNVLEVSRDLIYKLNLQTRTYDYVSPSALRLTGFTFEELAALGLRGTQERVHPEDLGRYRVSPDKLPSPTSQSGPSPVIEYRWKCKDGEYRWFSDNRALARDDDGRPLATVGTVRDITERRQADEEMANRLRMESAVARASNLLAQPEDADSALNLALPILAESFGAERGAILVVRGKNQVEAVSEWHAPGVSTIEGLQNIDLAGAPWFVERIARGEPIIVPDVSALPPEAAVEKEAWLALGIRSLLAVALTSNFRSIGCLVFDNTEGTRVWREEDVGLLRLASESISFFIERQRAAAEKRKAYESIILLLATAAEARDPYTENHLHRVRGYTEAIALELGLGPEEAREIGLAALLHDLGKIRVPDVILTKQGPLSEEEWRVMRKHPIWSEELLPPDRSFKTARQIARWHHENWDGTGYPDGLAGDLIPLCAAIAAVADAFDAMTSRRPYKGPWPPVRALREISEQRGKRYSPLVVDAFLRAVDNGDISKIAIARRTRPLGLKKAA